jgi:hypothetical protein
MRILASLILVAGVAVLSALWRKMMRRNGATSLLDDITARGDEIRTRLRELLQRHKYPGNTKNFVLGAYVDVALEHHEATWLLTKSKLNGSAFAMARSVLDPYFRFLWVDKVATADQIEQVWRDDLDWRRISLRTDIERAYFKTPEAKEDAEVKERATKGFQFLGKMSTTLSGYVHPSGLQLGRRFTADQVKPNYSEAEIVEVLDWTSRVLMMLVRVFFASMGHSQETEEIKAMLQQYYADFAQRLRATNQTND